VEGDHGSTRAVVDALIERVEYAGSGRTEQNSARRIRGKSFPKRREEPMWPVAKLKTLAWICPSKAEHDFA
jgi:hypothetical protein